MEENEPCLPLGKIEVKELPTETCESCGQAIVQLDTIDPKWKLWVDADTTRGNDRLYRKGAHKIHGCKRKLSPKVEREAAFKAKASAYLRKP